MHTDPQKSQTLITDHHLPKDSGDSSPESANPGPMVPKSSPEWLPAGWAVQFRVTRGRQIQYYTNLRTGENFFSKDDVMRSVKKESSHGEEPHTTTSLIKNYPEKKSNHLAESQILHPEWLPNSWKVELRVRKTGLDAGREYKCYIDPSTENTFYSKPEVIRYLETVKWKDCSSTNLRTASPKRCITRQMAVTPMQLAINVDVEKHNVEDEDIPPGWTKEIKVRRVANRLKRDPYYTDPVSGYVFRSKKGVMHYLETGKSRHAFKPKSTCASDLELINDVFSPSPATKRQKVKHPVTRLQLSGDEGSSEMSCLELPEAESFNVQDKRVPTESTNTISSSVKVVQDRCLTEHMLEESPKTREDCSPNSLVQPTAELPYICEGKRSLLEFDGSTRDPDKSNIGVAQTDLSKSKNKNKLSLPCRSSKRLAGLDPELANMVSSERALRAATNRSSNSHASEDAGLASDHIVNTAYPQLVAASKTEVAEHSLTDRKCSPDEEPLNKGRMPIIDELDLKEQQLKLEIGKNEKMDADKSCRRKMRASKSKKSTELKLPDRSSKRLAGIEPERLMVSSERALRAATRKSSKSDGRQEADLSQQLWAASETDVAEHTVTAVKFTSPGEPLNNAKMPVDDKVVPKEQQQKLETQKMDAEKPEQELNILFGSDPTVEFAIRTLTGELPIADTVGNRSILEHPADMLPKDGSIESGLKKSCIRKTRASESKKNNELKSPHRSSKWLAGVKPELLVHTGSSDRALQNSIEKSGKSKCVTFVDLADEASQRLKAGPETNLASHPCTAINTSTQLEPLTNREKSLANQAFPEDKRFKSLAEKADVEIPEQQFLFPTIDSWTDPWLDFAVKTLTGAIPIEDDMFPGCFLEKLETSHNQRDILALPDFEFQSDILPQFDAQEQSVSGQQLLTKSSFLPSENAIMPNCSGVMGQQSSTSSSSLSAGTVSLANCSGVGSGQPLSTGSSFLPSGNAGFSNCSRVGSGQHLPTNSWSLPPGIVSFSNGGGVGSGPQLPTNSSFLTAGNVSMSNCNGVGLVQPLSTISSFPPTGNVILSNYSGESSGQPSTTSSTFLPAGNLSLSNYSGLSSSKSYL